MGEPKWLGWIGALTGPAALVWNIFVYLRKGSRLKLRGWFHPDPHSERALIHVDVRNKGDEPVKIESIQVAQDGKRFRQRDFYVPFGGRGGTPNEVSVRDHKVFEVQCSDRPSEGGPQSRARLPVITKPATVYVRTTASEKEFVLKIPAGRLRPDDDET